MEKTLKPTTDEKLLTEFFLIASIFFLFKNPFRKKLLDYPYYWDDESPNE